MFQNLFMIMQFDPLRHHRESIRLQGYDYSSEGAYFVTMCTNGRECLFGEVANGEMKLSQIGEIVQQCWMDLPDHFSNVTLDEYQTMPNHVHGIVVIWGKHGRDLINQIPTGVNDAHFVTQTDWPSMKNPKQTLGKIIRHFKAKATKKIHDGGFAYFAWQGRFHDHIIRDEEDLERIRHYIRENPLSWSTDDENPGKSGLRTMPNAKEDKPMAIRCPVCKQVREPNYNETERRYVCPLCASPVVAQVLIEKKKRGMK